LANRPKFAEISPEVGVLDQDAFSRALEEDAEQALSLLAEMSGATDEALRAAARALAAKIALDRAKAGTPRRRGIGKMRSVAGGLEGDLDLDASLPAIAEARATGHAISAEDLSVRQWTKPTLALCLVIDASGSMGGARLAAAALTAAACAWRAPGEHAVLSFNRDVTVLRPLNSERGADLLVDDILRLRGHGVTALSTALKAANEQLAGSRASRRVVVLLSDCRATDENDPVPAACALPELLILAPADDYEQAADLAAHSGGRWAAMAGAADAPAALLGLLEAPAG
jgi:Mg-chelatase subunit ChlD